MRKRIRSAFKKSHSVKGIFGTAFLLSLLLGYHAPAAKAHGALIEVNQKSVEVNATFEDGEPMKNAQVLIYAPDDLQSPWAKGETDAAGRYQFEPEAENIGIWEVTVRQAGHGGTTSFEVGETGYTLSAASGTVSPLQKWGTIAAVVWGFVGTALFFSARAASKQTSSKQTSSKQTSSKRAFSEPIGDNQLSDSTTHPSIESASSVLSASSPNSAQHSGSQS
ncbi:MAG: hypothetical protein AAFQ63_14220 [Cyanobacteria bacterium J06621_11]